jgi:hypothetical protein
MMKRKPRSTGKKNMAKQPQADTHLDEAYSALGLSGRPASEKYAVIDDIISHLAAVNAAAKIGLGTTGAITERLCVLGLEEVKETVRSFGYRKFRRDWKWIGDLLVPGDPYDLAISVKSYKAKERLLASGTGSLLTPTIGWGLFNDPSEWSADRTASYLYRGFVAIYMPADTLARVPVKARNVANINGIPLLRDLLTFPGNVRDAISNKTNRVDFRKL